MTSVSDARADRAHTGDRVGGTQTSEERSVISRAFAVLAALDDRGSGSSLAQLVERTGLPKGSLHRLCAQLVAQGAVERTDFGYRLGQRMFELGSQAAGPRQLRDLALPYMSELHTMTRCAVHLSVLAGNRTLVLNSVTGRDHEAQYMAPGGRITVTATASGKALLAHSTPELKAGVLSSLDCAPEFREELDLIAAGKVATIHTGPLLQGLALPVFDRNRYSIAALSVCAYSFPSNHQPVVDALRQCVATIEKKLRSVPESIWHKDVD